MSVDQAQDQAIAFAERLEQVFTSIAETRMADVPILNAKLCVEAVGFTKEALSPDGAGPSRVSGILITPWFINLVAFAEPDETGADPVTQGRAVTETVHLTWPSGTFPFLVCEEPGIGRFAMCSLFSPVLEFTDQGTARAVAEASLEHMFDAGLDSGPSEEEAAISAMWQGQRFAPKTPQPSAPECADHDATSLTLDDAPSRRALLTGQMFKPSDDSEASSAPGTSR